MSQRHRAAQQVEGAREVPGGQFRLAQCDESAGDPSWISHGAKCGLGHSGQNRAVVTTSNTAPIGSSTTN